MEYCEGHQINGTCHKKTCPQLRDGEPGKTGRVCPIYKAEIATPNQPAPNGKNDYQPEIYELKKKALVLGLGDYDTWPVEQRVGFDQGVAVARWKAEPAPAEGITTVRVHAGEVLPDVKKGSMKAFIVTIDKGTTTFPAYYLNEYPLEYNDSCDERGCPKDEEHADGCPTTGWFYDQSNFEYDNCYHKIAGEIVAYVELPTVEALQAAFDIARKG